MQNTNGHSGMPPKGAKVLVAMSGGVDSSAAAALLLEQGYEVVGCFMRLGSPGETIDEMMPFDSAGVSCDPSKVKIGHQGCCSVGDAADAREVAAKLGIPLYVCNFKKDFGRIIDYFVDAYASGRTPNPCVRCNDWLKFGKLHEYAQQIGAGYVASGHYARIDRSNGSPKLLRGLDDKKDQSYVLFGAPRDRLAEMLLPIGEYATKAEVRAIAEKHDLPVFDKPDSQEICFVPDNDYAGLVERRRPELRVKGKIVNLHGEQLGEHDGQHKYTIGQRRGLGVAAGEPIYVVDKDPETNTVTVGSNTDLMAQSCVAHEANWLIDESELRDWKPVLAQHRYNSAPVPARVRIIDREDPDTPSGRVGCFECVFDVPQRAVTPGQALALYDFDHPEIVLGGGWIETVS
ncbi:MAG: tRNA 2-thiouridine(34) synthase MnmA [Phycisphaerales bacterium]|nr:tRNA 2-thiouridine(34) synthase MnmA [Phycisphaerales bacterium]